MIHVARVWVSLPGPDWIGKKHNDAVRTNDIVDCERGTVKIWSQAGEVIDTSDELGYDFVLYDWSTGRTIIEVYVGDGDEGATSLFCGLFPNLRDSETTESDPAFLIVPPVNSPQAVQAWALFPSGKDSSPGVYSATETDEYCRRLLDAAK